MSKNKILLGATIAAVVNVASASAPNIQHEKQLQAETMNKLLNGITVVLKNPECTVKQA